MKKSSGQKSTIQKKLLMRSIGIIVIFQVLVGAVSSYMNYASTLTSLKQTMKETVRVAAQSIEHDLETYEKLADELTYNPLFRSFQATREELIAECESLAARNGVDSVGIGDSEGISRTDGISLAGQEYFNVPKQTGQTYVSDPIIRRDNGEMNIIVSAPIMVDNKFEGIVYIGLDASFLCELVSNIKIGESGNASLINSRGDTIGYQDVQLVLDAYNTQEELKNDKGLAQLAAIEREVMAGKTGFGKYSYGGVAKFTAYAPVPGTNGWGLYVAVTQSEFMSSTYWGIVVVVVLLLAAIGAAAVLMARFAVSIVKPIQLCVERIQALSKGDIHSQVPSISTGDEIQTLAESTGDLIENMGLVIRDIDYCMTEMSQGNFAVHSMARESYVGDFQNILKAIQNLKYTLSDALKQIAEVAGQVALGSEQMAESAQSLAEGATEQAGAVEELTATITNVTAISVESAQGATEAYEKASESAKKAQTSDEEMNRLIDAMERISDTSKEIENIIGAIEDIASQTNLLSLNASIEAARAGEAGKGFAVVADQIGKLAADSAKSAVNTRELIGKSLQEIEAGNEITKQTGEKLKEIIEEMKLFAQMAYSASESSKVQADTMKEVENGIGQIASVIESNSAAAEETSAASQELSAQSDNMNQLVGKFQL